MKRWNVYALTRDGEMIMLVARGHDEESVRERILREYKGVYLVLRVEERVFQYCQTTRENQAAIRKRLVV